MFVVRTGSATDLLTIGVFVCPSLDDEHRAVVDSALDDTAGRRRRWEALRTQRIFLAGWASNAYAPLRAMHRAAVAEVYLLLGCTGTA